MDNDNEIWKIYVRTVKPLKPYNIPVSVTQETPKQEQEKTVILSDAQMMTRLLPTISTSLSPVCTPVMPLHNSLKLAEKNKRKKLLKGNFEPEATLDLHGLSRDNAYHRLYQFIVNSYHAGHRYLLVITGKGRYCYETYQNTGLLKGLVTDWFKESHFSQYVSVVQTASSTHGGDGAYYVILTKKNKASV